MADHETILVMFQILRDRLILEAFGETTPKDAILGGRGPNEGRL